MPKPKIYTVNGYTGTLSQICTNLGLNYNTIVSRMSKGMPLEEAISLPITSKSRNNEVHTVGGFTGNLTEVCNHFGLNYSSVYRRVNKGMPIEDAIKLPTRPAPKVIIYTVNDFTGNLTEICSHFGVKYSTVLGRLKQGTPVEDAVKTPVREVKKYTVNGFTGSLREICEHFEVSHNLIRARIRSGMALEDAVSRPVSPRKKARREMYTVDGFTGTVAQICNHFGVQLATVNSRMSKGMTLEEAIIAQPTKAKLYEVNGFVGTLSQVCNHFGLSKGRIENRLRRDGLSIEEAISVPLQRCPTVWRYNGKKLPLKEICKIENRDFVEVYNLLKYCHTLEYSLQNASVGYSEE